MDAKKHVRKNTYGAPTSPLTIRDLQIKTTTRPVFTPVEMTVVFLKSETMASIGEGVGKLGPLCFAGGSGK